MDKNIQIIVIDDDLETETRPFFLHLGKKYGKENVIWKEEPNDGLNYVKENLSKRTIVLLDYHFGSNQTNGFRLFNELQKESSLLYIIIYTAQEVSTIPAKELKACINNHLMGMVDKPLGGSAELMIQIENAVKYLNNRVDCILEEWIIRHESFKRETPYMRDENGNSISLNDVLREIRMDTEKGKNFASNIISLAITMMQNDIDNLKK
jgi:DNA-binding NtrC family response regulator